MELCADSSMDIESDRDLAMRCCKLAMVLMKRMEESTIQHLNIGKFRKADKRSGGGAGVSTDGDDNLALPSISSRANATEQLLALLSFKEALCTGGLFYFFIFLYT